MERLSDIFLHGEIYMILRVFSWPRWARRAFVILAPITLPLWLLMLPMMLILQIVGIIVLLIGFHLREIWQADDEPPSYPARCEDCE